MEWILNSDGPIWAQLTEQLRQRIVTGMYPPGEKLPPVRELAAEAGVNPNTMQRALAQLEADGLAVTNRTTGRIVTDDEAVIKRLRMSMAQERINTYLSSMEVLGFSRQEACDLLTGKEREEDKWLTN